MVFGFHHHLLQSFKGYKPQGSFERVLSSKSSTALLVPTILGCVLALDPRVKAQNLAQDEDFEAAKTLLLTFFKFRQEQNFLCAPCARLG